jgi:hypothetical protein
LFRLLRTLPIPQGGTVGFLLSPASRASGVPFINCELTPSETDSPSALPDSARRAIETNDLERRVEGIEERLEDAPGA